MADQQPKTARPNGVAVDFGGTKISAARVTDGIVGETVRTQTDGNARVGDQISAIVDLLDQLRLKPDERVGIALAGRVSSAGDWFALNTETLTKVTAVPLRRLMSQRLGRPVLVQNDAIAAAIGEHGAGAGRGTDNFAFITVSTGVGGGIISNGRPLISANGLAGHVGFTTSRIATGRCGSGRMKTVESVASGRAIAALAGSAGHDVADAKAVYQAHLAGAAWATGLIRQSAAAVAELCANLKSLLDLERIALGGSIGLARGYLDMVQRELAREPEIFRPEIMRAELGQDAAILGILLAEQ